jgi:hypothetical protein
MEGRIRRVKIKKKAIIIKNYDRQNYNKKISSGQANKNSANSSCEENILSTHYITDKKCF